MRAVIFFSGLTAIIETVVYAFLLKLIAPRAPSRSGWFARLESGHDWYYLKMFLIFRLVPSTVTALASIVEALPSTSSRYFISDTFIISLYLFYLVLCVARIANVVALVFLFAFLVAFTRNCIDVLSAEYPDAERHNGLLTVASGIYSVGFVLPWILSSTPTSLTILHVTYYVFLVGAVGCVGVVAFSLWTQFSGKMPDLPWLIMATVGLGARIIVHIEADSVVWGPYRGVLFVVVMWLALVSEIAVVGAFLEAVADVGMPKMSLLPRWNRSVGPVSLE